MLLTEFKAYGKINLFLEVGRKRDDGFHDIQTILHKTDNIFDTVKIEKREKKGYTLNCNIPAVPTDESNLMIKALHTFHNAIELPVSELDYGYEISLHKQIPVAGGMGGGSSDAGTLLREINKAYGSPLDIDTLVSLASTLGSDVPFFVFEHQAMYGRGRGEQLTPCPSLPECEMQFVSGGTKLSTGAMYTELDRLNGQEEALPSPKGSVNDMLEALKKADTDTVLSLAFNSFEAVFKKLTESTPRPYSLIHSELLSKGAKKILLCGSGPTVCAFFR